MSAATDRPTLLDLAADVCALALTLAQLPERPDAERLLAAANTRLEVFERVAKAQGFAAADIRDSSFAITALLDEVVLEARGPEVDAWRERPLVRERHGEADPASGFFTRLDKLKADAPHSVDALEVYAACLALGFAGALARDEDALAARLESAIAAVRAARGPLPALGKASR